MNLQSQQHDEPEINLTSLIDVVFLLLIFFMVTTSFINESAVSLQLPTASSEPPADDPPAVEVTVSSEGRYFFGGDELVDGSRAGLRRALLERSEHDTGRMVVIRADARAPHQSVVTVMDVAGRAGFARVSIVTAQVEND